MCGGARGEEEEGLVGGWECGRALKRREGPADTFYSLCVCVGREARVLELQLGPRALLLLQRLSATGSGHESCQVAFATRGFISKQSKPFSLLGLKEASKFKCTGPYLKQCSRGVSQDGFRGRADCNTVYSNNENKTKHKCRH